MEDKQADKHAGGQTHRQAPKQADGHAGGRADRQAGGQADGALLKASRLCKSYASDGLQNHVLRNIDLELHTGEFTVVMGASGSGKSTLLYCLSLMDEATSGSVCYGGEQLEQPSEKRLAELRSREFGFVFQQIHLVENLTLTENVAVAGYLTLGAKDAHERAAQLLKQLGLEGLERRLPSQVSGGQAQRAALARALVNTPRLLFADEPTGALNSSAGLEILDLLTGLNAEGQTILMVTHDLKAAIRGSRLLYLRDGSICSELLLARYEDPPQAGEHGQPRQAGQPPQPRQLGQSGRSAREAQVVAWLSSLGW